ncbi:LysR family transcriptional regulator [Variovorax sp. E3]|uniref:LysR family transcriptional regulator n=1 Tax=Variovorax sp. E3 TaxID=1914993 RepID=UPI0018DDB9D8|nr:LysR family transcriptional regulator [Variovorax sp. E3]
MARPPFRLHHIQLLQTVLQSTTMTEAANRLHISQPAVSKQLKQLQEDVGYALFERQGHRLQPTFEARALLDQVNRVGASLQVLNQLATDMRTSLRGHLQIGAVASAADLLLPNALRQTFGPQSRVLCTVETGNTAQVLEWVDTQQVDLGIAMKVRDIGQRSFEPLVPLRLGCLLPREHPLAKRRRVRLKDLENESVIALKLPSLVDSHEDTNLDIGHAIAVHMHVDSSRMAWRMVEAGLGIAVLEDLSAAHYGRGDLAYRPLEHPFRTELGMYRPAYRPRNTAVEDLVRALADSIKAPNHWKSTPAATAG